MPDKVKCRCGKETENIKSYTEKKSGLRLTVCESCAAEYGLNDETKFDIVSYDKNNVQLRPAPNLN